MGREGSLEEGRVVIDDVAVDEKLCGVWAREKVTKGASC